MEIISPGRAGKELTAAINGLIGQLSESALHVSQRRIQEIIDARECRLLVAVDRGAVLGMLTLIVYAIPTGVRAVIEDLVVDGAARGAGAGHALLQGAIARAQAMGANTVNLTCNPCRRAADRLYRKLGFKRRETNVYRLSLIQKNQ